MAFHVRNLLDTWCAFACFGALWFRQTVVFMVILFDNVINGAFECFFDPSFVFLFLQHQKIYVFYSAFIVFLRLLFVFVIFET